MFLQLKTLCLCTRGEQSQLKLEVSEQTKSHFSLFSTGLKTSNHDLTFKETEYNLLTLAGY